jgi:hypothetical protein
VTRSAKRQLLKSVMALAAALFLLVGLPTPAAEAVRAQSACLVSTPYGSVQGASRGAACAFPGEDT